MYIPSDGKRWVSAPHTCGLIQTGDIEGVFLYSDEEVHWTYYGNRVVGYTVTKRPEFTSGSNHRGFTFNADSLDTDMQIYCQRCWRDIVVRIPIRATKKDIDIILTQYGWRVVEESTRQICADCVEKENYGK